MPGKIVGIALASVSNAWVLRISTITYVQLMPLPQRQKSKYGTEELLTYMDRTGRSRTNPSGRPKIPKLRQYIPYLAPMARLAFLENIGNLEAGIF